MTSKSAFEFAKKKPSRRLVTHVISGGLALSGLAVALPAGAQIKLGASGKVDPAELAKPGPLGDKVMGKDDAPVTIIEYASLTCGHCAAFHRDNLPALKEKYIDTGKAKLIFREFPLDPLSTAASMISRCATNERYFPMVSAFFGTQLQWAQSDKPLEALLVLSRQAGFSQESFEACLKDQKIYDGLNDVKKRGAETFGVNSTPTFFINGMILRGNQTVEEFAKIIDPMLK